MGVCQCLILVALLGLLQVASALDFESLEAAQHGLDHRSKRQQTPLTIQTCTCTKFGENCDVTVCGIPNGLPASQRVILYATSASVGFLPLHYAKSTAAAATCRLFESVGPGNVKTSGEYIVRAAIEDENNLSGGLLAQSTTTTCKSAVSTLNNGVSITAITSDKTVDTSCITQATPSVICTSKAGFGTLNAVFQYEILSTANVIANMAEVLPPRSDAPDSFRIVKLRADLLNETITGSATAAKHTFNPSNIAADCYSTYLTVVFSINDEWFYPTAETGKLPFVVKVLGPLNTISAVSGPVSSVLSLRDACRNLVKAPNGNGQYNLTTLSVNQCTSNTLQSVEVTANALQGVYTPDLGTKYAMDNGLVDPDATYGLLGKTISGTGLSNTKCILVPVGGIFLSIDPCSDNNNMGTPGNGVDTVAFGDCAPPVDGTRCGKVAISITIPSGSNSIQTVCTGDVGCGTQTLDFETREVSFTVDITGRCSSRTRRELEQQTGIQLLFGTPGPALVTVTPQTPPNTGSTQPPAIRARRGIINHSINFRDILSVRSSLQ